MRTRFIDVAATENGRSMLASEKEVELVPGEDKEIWQSFETSDRTPFYPGPNSSLLRFFVLPPPNESLTTAEWSGIAAEFFSRNKIEHCRVDTSQHPLMHATPTEDCVILLSGRAQLILDEGTPIELRPFDVVRQRRTNHSWINLGPGPAVFISLMHGVEVKSTSENRI